MFNQRTSIKVQHPHPDANDAARDISGYAIFSQGDAGGMHALAHRMVDSGQYRLGHRLLASWLDGRTGGGSDWVHLHFHMALFELALGDWHAAHTRFLRQVLPAARTHEALTDAPGLLWRIAMAAPVPTPLPWHSLRQAALANLPTTDDPFVLLHHLLALAGSGDVRSIEDWMRFRETSLRTPQNSTLGVCAQALSALALRQYREAADRLESLLPRITRLGGSHAQNGLFDQLANWAALRAGTMPEAAQAA